MNNFNADSFPTDWTYSRLNGKAPFENDWYYQGLSAKDVSFPTNNIGVCLGHASNGFMAIDFDGTEGIEFFESEIMPVNELCKDNPIQWTSFRHDRFQVGFKVPKEFWEHLKTIKVSPNKKLEFRWTGSQSVLPPSKHPDTGMDYGWLEEPNSTNLDFELPDAVLAYWLEKCIQANTEHSTGATGSTTFDEPTEQDVHEVLTELKDQNPRFPYDVWRDICFAVFHSIGTADGEPILKGYWPEERGGEYRKLIKDFKPDSSPTFGTLMHLARERNPSFTLSHPIQPKYEPPLAMVVKPKTPASVKTAKGEYEHGLKLQKLSCGVSGSVWKPHDITAHWTAKGSDPANAVCVTLSDKVCHLAELSKYAVKKVSGGWLYLKDVSRTTSTTNQEWGNYLTIPSLPNGESETKSEYEARQFGYVKKFIQTQMKSINGKVNLPIDQPFIVMNRTNEICLNEYTNETIEPNETEIIKALPILRMIRYSLCAEPVYQGTDDSEFKDMIEEIKSQNLSNFRWVIHWLARIRQNIGIVSGVALVLHGVSTGIGKNTLSQIMKSILGDNVCSEIESLDFDNGWTNAAVGAIWNHADDWQNGKLKSYEDLLKKFITNEQCTVNARQVGNQDRINTASWYFTNNEVDPIAVTDNERRYSVIETTNNQTLGRKLAKIVFDASRHDPKAWREMVEAFNNLLCSVEVDTDFVRLPLENEHRTELKEMNKNTVEQWLDLISQGPYAGESFLASQFFDMFKDWHLETFNEETKYKIRGFGLELKKHPSKCMKKRTERGNEWTLLEQ